MEWQTWDLQFAHLVAPQAEKILNVVSPLCSNSYTLCVEGGFSEANVLTPGSLLSVASMIITPLHGPLRAWSEPSSVSDSGPSTESVNSQGQEDNYTLQYGGVPFQALEYKVAHAHPNFDGTNHERYLNRSHRPTLANGSPTIRPCVERWSNYTIDTIHC